MQIGKLRNLEAKITNLVEFLPKSFVASKKLELLLS